MSPSAPPPIPQAAVPVIGYAGPAGPGSADSVFRQGNVIVAIKGATLPTRCVKCNAPADAPPKMRLFYWFPRLVLLLLPLGLLPFAIVAVVMQKRGEIYFTVCKKHRSRRNRAMLIAWLAVIIGAAGFIAGLAGVVGDTRGGAVSWAVPVGLVLILAGAVYGVIASKILSPSRIDKTYVHLKGACAEYLNTLPGSAN